MRSLWKEKDEEQGGGAPEWMVTFSDAMTLLMVFFILLFSMSTIDAKKEAQLSMAFNNIFNGGGNNPIVDEGVGDETLNNGSMEEEIEEHQDSLVNILNELIIEKGLKDFISVEIVERGVSVVVVDSLLFNQEELI